MKTKTLTQTKNPFLKREELILEIETQGTPSIEKIVEATKKDPETVIVKRIMTNFGTNTCKAEILIYETKEAKEKTEVIPKKIRKKMEEERKAAEEAAKKAAEEEAKKKAEEEAAAKEATENTEEETKTEETKE